MIASGNGNLEPDGVGGTYNGDVLKKRYIPNEKRKHIIQMKNGILSISGPYTNPITTAIPTFRIRMPQRHLLRGQAMKEIRCWETVGNWDPKKVPDADDNVLIS